MRWLFMSSIAKLIGLTSKDQYWKWKQEKENGEEGGRGWGYREIGARFSSFLECVKSLDLEIWCLNIVPLPFSLSLANAIFTQTVFLSGLFLSLVPRIQASFLRDHSISLHILVPEHSEPCRLIQQITFKVIALQFLRKMKQSVSQSKTRRDVL